MNVTLNLNNDESQRLLLSLLQKDVNRITIEQDGDKLNVFTNIVDSHGYIKLIKSMMNQEYMEDLVSVVPEDIIEEVIKGMDIQDEMNLDDPAIIPSEVLDNQSHE